MKKQFVTSKLLKENREKTEKAIIESFAKTFNKIKREGDIKVNEAMYDKMGNFLGGPDPNEGDGSDPYGEDPVTNVKITYYNDGNGIDDVSDAEVEGVTKKRGRFSFHVGQAFRQMDPNEQAMMVEFFNQNVQDGDNMINGEALDMFLNLLGRFDLESLIKYPDASEYY